MTAKNHVWGPVDEEDFAEEDSTTVQVELVSKILKNSWSVYTCWVDDDTTMSQIAKKSFEIQPLPQRPLKTKYGKIRSLIQNQSQCSERYHPVCSNLPHTIQIIHKPCDAKEGIRFQGRAKPLPMNRKFGDLVGADSFANFRLRAVPK